MYSFSNFVVLPSMMTLLVAPWVSATQIVLVPAMSPFTATNYDPNTMMLLSVEKPVTSSIVCSLVDNSSQKECSGLFDLDLASSNGNLKFTVETPFADSHISIDMPQNIDVFDPLITLEFRAMNTDTNICDAFSNHTGDLQQALGVNFTVSIEKDNLTVADFEGYVEKGIVRVGVCEIYTSVVLPVSQLLALIGQDTSTSRIFLSSLSWSAKFVASQVKAGPFTYMYSTRSEMDLKTETSLHPSVISVGPEKTFNFTQSNSGVEAGRARDDDVGPLTHSASLSISVQSSGSKLRFDARIAGAVSFCALFSTAALHFI